MNLKIKKLMPEMVNEYLHFFDNTPHDDGKPENICYCINWCAENDYNRVDDPQRTERKYLAQEYIKRGTLQGYLAFMNGEIVGWVNVNTKHECSACYGYTHYLTDINELPYQKNEKVKSIFCFVIAPSMKRKGIATKLIEFICQDASRDGYDFVEAYPYKQNDNEYLYYVGLTSLYEKCGFTTYMETKSRYIMRKKL